MKKLPPGVSEVKMYAKREEIYAREAKGRYATLRVLCVWLTQLMFYGLPWCSWNGRQAVLFDLAARKFYIFGIVFMPQDFIYLAALLIIAAYALFLVTAMAGRVWCGFACPQTVYTEVFMWIERKIEGERSARMRLDRQPMSVDKFVKKAAKHTAWILVAAWTGISFVGYFSPIKELMQGVLGAGLGPWEWFWIVFYGFATYGNAGWMREQVCKYMCPYARFQSSMLDRDTLIITYDTERGEPRGARSKNAAAIAPTAKATLAVDSTAAATAVIASSAAATVAAKSAPKTPAAATMAADIGAPGHAAASTSLPAGVAAAAIIEQAAPVTETAGSEVPGPHVRANITADNPDSLVTSFNPLSPLKALGDCIDCSLCVQVCPVGIDIRDGLQYECIGCAACIDACNTVMAKIGAPPGLIRYSTENAMVNRWSEEQIKKHVWRPRVLVYIGLLVVILGVFFGSLIMRTPLKMDVIRDRGMLGREVEDGMIENVYRLQIMNAAESTHTYRLTVSGIPTIKLDTPDQIVLEAGARTVAARVRVQPHEGTPGSNKIRFELTAIDDPALHVKEPAVFFVPN